MHKHLCIPKARPNAATTTETKTLNIYIHVHKCAYTYIPVYTYIHKHVCIYVYAYSSSSTRSMGWLRLVGSLKLYVSFAKEPCKRDYILQKRPVILRSLLNVAIP